MWNDGEECHDYSYGIRFDEKASICSVIAIISQLLSVILQQRTSFICWLVALPKVFRWRHPKFSRLNNYQDSSQKFKELLFRTAIRINASGCCTI